MKILKFICMFSFVRCSRNSAAAFIRSAGCRSSCSTSVQLLHNLRRSTLGPGYLSTRLSSSSNNFYGELDGFKALSDDLDGTIISRLEDMGINKPSAVQASSFDVRTYLTYDHIDFVSCDLLTVKQLFFFFCTKRLFRMVKMLS